MFSSFFFFNDTATTEIYTLSLHDALPIYPCVVLARVDVRERAAPEDLSGRGDVVALEQPPRLVLGQAVGDRKSTRLNSSHLGISYAVFCLKKKKKEQKTPDNDTTHPHQSL